MSKYWKSFRYIVNIVDVDFAESRVMGTWDLFIELGSVKYI